VPLKQKRVNERTGKEKRGERRKDMCMGKKRRGAIVD
jgi:hypothetical protein